MRIPLERACVCGRQLIKKAIIYLHMIILSDFLGDRGAHQLHVLRMRWCRRGGCFLRWDPGVVAPGTRRGDGREHPSLSNSSV
eukprot:12708538-Alexandrium_andersonii.AAC.1